MPTTTYFGQTYVTPFDPAYVDLWGTALNNLHVLWDSAHGRAMAAGTIPYPEASKNYGIVPSIRFPATVKKVALWTDAGTLTADCKIGSTSITSLDAIAVTSSWAQTSATGANTMTADTDGTQSLYISCSSISSTVTLLYYSFWIDRTGAGTA